MDSNTVKELIKMAYKEGVVDSTINSTTDQTCSDSDLYEQSGCKVCIEKLIAYEERINAR